ncbi:MAG: soprulation-specific penicillin-binding protein [Firmicutes bacterium]|nr:soprulation-specific penicillin-binding protein [Bacillota bacterium]
MATGIYSRRRTIALMGIFALAFVSLTGRMGYLQLEMGNKLGDMGFRYRMRPTPIQADRGEILDRNGQPLLKNVVCESVYAQPILIKNKPAAASALSPILGMKADDLEARMSRPSFFEWLKRKVPPETRKQVAALGITGIGFAPEKCRQYPEGDLAVHLLGISNLDHQGIEGLDLWYNKSLSGVDGAIQCEYTARGLPMDGGDCKVMDGKPGLTLQTTVDVTLQRLLERAVERAALETKAKRVYMGVMQVKTGEMLSLAQWPKFDPLLGGNSDPQSRRLGPVVDTLPPGSIFKPVTATAVLNEGVINKDTVIPDAGCTTVSGWQICNWNHQPVGGPHIDRVMAGSSNVGFATLGMWLGRDRFYKYLDAFGFTQVTGVDLPGEALGQWIPKKSASDIDLAVQGFGQTLTVSPIQMLAAIGAIANDGKLMWPHFGKALLDSSGTVVQTIDPRVVRQVARPEVARYVQELMVGVVDTGTGRNARVPGYKIGGKTGTATKVIDGKLAQGKYIASFVGFAPYPNPELVVLISVDEPQGAYYGGQIAAPIFGELMGEVLGYLNVPRSNLPPPPSRPGEPPAPKSREKAFVPSIVNLPVAEADRVARAAGMELFVQGGGAYVTEQFPLAGTMAYRDGQMVANTDLPEPGEERVHVPPLAGKSLSEAAQALALRGLLMDAQGTGVVVKQQPEGGAILRKGTPVKVLLEPLPKR